MFRLTQAEAMDAILLWGAIAPVAAYHLGVAVRQIRHDTQAVKSKGLTPSNVTVLDGVYAEGDSEEGLPLRVRGTGTEHLRVIRSRGEGARSLADACEASARARRAEGRVRAGV